MDELEPINLCSEWKQHITKRYILYHKYIDLSEINAPFYEYMYCNRILTIVRSSNTASQSFQYNNVESWEAVNVAGEANGM